MFGAFDRTTVKSTSLTPSQHTFDKEEFGENSLADTHLNRSSSRMKAWAYTWGDKGDDEWVESIEIIMGCSDKHERLSNESVHNIRSARCNPHENTILWKEAEPIPC